MCVGVCRRVGVCGCMSGCGCVGVCGCMGVCRSCVSSVVLMRVMFSVLFCCVRCMCVLRVLCVA